MKTYFRLFLGLLALAALSGCAGVMEFKAPKEFRDGKVTEDPPGTMLPLEQKVRAC